VVAFALIDVVPYIAARETHERPGEFSVINPKGLFQHNLPGADIRPGASLHSELMATQIAGRRLAAGGGIA
jgi:hypothetical protein